MANSTVKQRIRPLLVAGVLGGAATALVRFRRRRAARRRDAGEKAFYDASDGLWPPVRPASERVHIEADRVETDPATAELIEEELPGDEPLETEVTSEVEVSTDDDPSAEVTSEVEVSTDDDPSAEVEPG